MLQWKHDGVEPLEVDAERDVDGADAEGVKQAEGDGHDGQEDLLLVPVAQLGQPEGHDRRQEEERVEAR